MKISEKFFFKLFKAGLSYSQTGEDRILSHFFRSIGRKKISYLDIGANHPVMNNNTYLFYRQGGSGVCVEPNPELNRLFKKTRPRDTCLNIGIGIQEEKVEDFYSMTSHPLSTFSKEDALQLDKDGKYRIKEVLKIPLKNINTIIKEHFSQAIDLVSIDVEGWNEEIVGTFDFTIHRPFCFCVETISFSDDGSGKKLTRIPEVFCANDYSIYADTHLNTIFIDNRSDKIPR